MGTLHECVQTEVAVIIRSQKSGPHGAIHTIVSSPSQQVPGAANMQGRLTQTTLDITDAFRNDRRSCFDGADNLP